MANLNFDMIGSPDYVRILAAACSPAPSRRRRRREAAVYGGEAGKPYDPCYHQACDTLANDSDQGLDEMSDAVATASTPWPKTQAQLTNAGSVKKTAAKRAAIARR